jgi:hypothetical protein
MKSKKKCLFVVGITLLSLYGLPGCSKQNQKVGVEPASLADMNRALITWGMMVHGPQPIQISDLTNSPILKDKILPTAPQGKKYTIDPAKRQVVLVDQ